MINPDNFTDVQVFLTFQAEVKQVSPVTEYTYRGHLKHLLEWADVHPFGGLAAIRPAFPFYLEGQINRSGELLSASHLASVCLTCRSFLQWAKKEWPGRYQALEENWIQSIRPSRGRSEVSELHTRQIYSLEDIRRLLSIDPQRLSDQRLRAGIALLFLSGMRIGAFMTLPFECVDLKRLRILQLPQKGVKTKFSKAAITTLLNIPDLLAVVKEWDNQVRPLLLVDAYWYAHLTANGDLSQERPTGARVDLKCNFGRSLRVLCDRAGVEYKSPHKLRHGHAVYALKLCRTVAELKAVSQNLMHSSLAITDGIYGNLPEDEISRIYTTLMPA